MPYGEKMPDIEPTLHSQNKPWVVLSFYILNFFIFIKSDVFLNLFLVPSLSHYKLYWFDKIIKSLFFSAYVLLRSWNAPTLPSIIQFSTLSSVAVFCWKSIVLASCLSDRQLHRFVFIDDSVKLGYGFWSIFQWSCNWRKERKESCSPSPTPSQYW